MDEDRIIPARRAGQTRHRRLSRWIARATGVVLLLVVAAVVFVLTPTGRDYVARFALMQIPLTDGYAFSVERSEGRFPDHLLLLGVSLRAPDGSSILSVDSAQVGIHILPLLTRRVQLTDVHASGVRIDATQDESGRWDLFDAFPVDTASTGLSIRIGRLSLADTHVRAAYYTGSATDSITTAGPVSLLAHDIEMVDRYGGRIDSLFAPFLPAGLETPATINLSASYFENTLQVRTARLSSDRSTLTANGEMTFVRRGVETNSASGVASEESARITATAAPIAFADLTPFVAGLDPSVVGEGTATFTRTGESWSADGALDFGTYGSATFGARVAGIESLRELTGDDSQDSRQTSESVSVDATIETANLSPAIFVASNLRLGGSLAVPLGNADRLSGSTRVRLRGPDVRDLSGDINADYRDTSMPALSIGGFAANAVVVNGRAGVNIDATLGGSPISLTGEIAPFEDPPMYDVVATIRDFDIGRLEFSGLPRDLESALTGTIRIAGTGFSDADFVATPDLRDSRVGSINVETLGGAISMTNQLVTAELNGRTVNGVVAVSATVDLQSEEWQIRRIAADELDFLALTGPAGTSLVTGSITASGSGFDPVDLRGSANLLVDTLGTTGLTLSDAKVVAEIEGGLIRFSQTGSVNGGSVASEGSYSFPDDSAVHRFALDEVRFDSLRLETIPGLAEQRGVISGTATGNLAVSGSRSMHGTLALNLLPSTINNASITDGSAEIEFDGAEVRFQFEADGSSGRLLATGTATPFAENPSYEVENVEVAGLDAGSLLGLENLSTRLNGTVAARYVPSASQPFAYTIHLDQSAINGQHGISGTIKVDSTREQVVLVDLTWPIVRQRTEPDSFLVGMVLVAPAATADDTTGGIRGEFAITPGSPSRFSATVDIRHADFGKFMRGMAGTTVDTVDSDVSFRLSLDGTGSGILDAIATLTVDSLTGSIGTNKIRSGSLVVRADSGLIDVERLQLETNAGTIDGQGPIVLDDSGRESAFYLSVNAEDLALISDLIPGATSVGGIGSVSAAVVGPTSAKHVTVDGTFGALAWGQTRSATVELFLETTIDEKRQFSSLDGRFRVVNLIVGTAAFRDTQIQATMVDTLIRFQAQSEIDNRRDATITGYFDPRPEARALTLTSANIRLDDERWALLQPSTLTYDEAFRIRNLLLFTDDQQIAVDGIVDLDGDQSLILTIENFRIGSVADMLGYAGLDGAMNGYLDLVGPAEAPVIQGDLNVDLESNRRAVGDLQIAVRYDSLQLRTSGFLNHEDGGSMVFDGLVPVDLRLAGEGEQALRVSAADATPDSDVDLTIEADSFSMGWLLPFLDPAVYSKLSGIVDVELAMRGTFAEPLMTGTATIRDGTIGLPTFGIEVTKLNGGFLFEDRFIRISNLRGESGRGRVVAVGSIELANLALGEFDISLDLEQFLAIDNSDYRASTAGDLLLYGTTRAPVVSGSLRLESLDLYYKGTIDEFEPVTLTERDLRQVEIVFGRRITAADTTTYDFFTALEIDVNLEMTRDSWLRSTQNPRMDVPFFGSLDVSKEPNESLQLFGTIDIVENRGRIVELGRRFDISRGTITYNGPLADPRIDLEAIYTVQTRGVGGQTEENIQISLLAQGSLQDLDLTLTSDPQMETTDILSYILVGRPARESLQFGGGEESFAADIALSQAAGFLEGLAGEELGLDVVRIEYEGTEIKLTAGKYLRPGIYVAISQPIVLNSGSTQTGGSTQSDRGLLVEVELVRGLLARLQQQGSVFGINLFWLYAY